MYYVVKMYTSSKTLLITNPYALNLDKSRVEELLLLVNILDKFKADLKVIVLYNGIIVILGKFCANIIMRLL